MAKFDEQAALAAGATPFAVKLYKAHNFLAMALLIWFGLFVLLIALYHGLGKPKALLDYGNNGIMTLFIVLWLSSIITLFMTNFIVRRLYVAAFISIFLHGFLLLFPLINAATMSAMAPEMPGQAKPSSPSK